MARIELRAENGREYVTIDGYVNVTGRESKPLADGKGGYFVEQIQKGAFAKAIKKATKITALLNHNWDKKIADTTNNLKVKEDVIGLRAVLETDNPEIVRLAKEKRLKGWSFDIAEPTETVEARENALPLRTITDFVMSEVSLIGDGYTPAYESTTVETRAEEADFEAEYIGFENKKYDNSKLKEFIEKNGGKI